MCQGSAHQEWQKITAFVHSDGCLNFIEESDDILVAGSGCKDHAVGDIPGTCFRLSKYLVSLFWPYTKARRKTKIMNLDD